MSVSIHTAGPLLLLTHQEKVDRVVYKVVLARLDLLRRGKVYSVLLARLLDIVVGPSQANDILVEVLQIPLNDLRGVPRRIATDEHRPHRLAVLLLDLVNHLGHLVQLFRADIGAVREAKVDQAVFALQIVLRKLLAECVRQLKWPAHQGLADTFILLCDPGARHPVFLIAEVDCQTSASEKEEQPCLPAEGAELVAGLGLFDRLVAKRWRRGESP